MKPVRVLFIGWDGAEPDLVEPWMEQGRLPVIAELRTRGAGGRLRSTVPAVTPPAWTSLVTGVDPGRHGIYSFTVPGGDDYVERFVTAAERQFPSVWHHLTAAGRRVGVFNLSLSYPPEPVPGFFFAGFDCPALGPHIAHPAEAFRVAIQGISGYVHGKPREIHGELAAREINHQMRCQRDMLRNLTKRFPVEVLAVNFNGPDHIHHFAWPVGQDADKVVASHGSPVEEVYREADAILGDLVESYADEDTNIIVVSDHGGGKMRGEVSLARALEAGGFLVRRRAVPPRPSGLARLRRLAIRMLPEKTLTRALDMAGMGFRQGVSRRLRAAQIAEVDWNRTVAFPWGSSGFIQVNMKGRQPQGCVSPEDRERVLEHLEAYLRELRDPATGQSPLGDIRRGEDIYRAPCVGYVPDLVVDDTEYHIVPKWDGELTVHNIDVAAEAACGSYRGVVANHRPEGILVTCGPAVRPGIDAPELTMADIAPALLYLAEVPIPEGLDGRLDSSVWDLGTGPERGAAVCPGDGAVQASPYSEQEQLAVEQRLRDLGYM